LKRRTKPDINRIRQTIYDILEADNPATVRQVYYRLVSQGQIAKTEAEYRSTVRLLTSMRLADQIPFNWIADNTRWMRKPRTFPSAEAAIQRTAEAYRRSIWDEQDVYVEIWLEKDALAGVVWEVTSQWDVPLMVTRGYCSLSFLHQAAQAIAAKAKPSCLYYLGDFDPSGLDISRSVEGRLREFAPDAVIHFERVAVTQEQIQDLHLPTRPTKASDTRSKRFAADSVEVDAIPPTRLRNLVRGCIEQHIDRARLERLKLVERRERALLQDIASRFPDLA
jgi:hypothetical protein